MNIDGVTLVLLEKSGLLEKSKLLEKSGSQADGRTTVSAGACGSGPRHFMAVRDGPIPTTAAALGAFTSVPTGRRFL